MISDPSVSVIIPCYNAGDYIKETVESVRKQKYSDYEIIIINDGSQNKKTLDVLANLSLDEKITILHQENSGPGIARNLGVQNAKGDFLVMLDADDLIREDTIITALDIFEKHPDTGVVYGNCNLFGKESGLRKQEPYNLRSMIVTNQIAMLSVMRKQTFVDSGGFDHFTSIYGYIEDHDLWLSIAETKWKFFYIDRILFDIRMNTVSRSTKKFHEREIAIQHIYKKHSDLLSAEFLKLYHENKNIKKTLDFRIGSFILKPLRRIKQALKNKKEK